MFIEESLLKAGLNIEDTERMRAGSLGGWRSTSRGNGAVMRVGEALELSLQVLPRVLPDYLACCLPYLAAFSCAFWMTLSCGTLGHDVLQ